LVGLGRRLEDRRELESVWVCKQDPFLGASFGSVTVLSSVTPMGIGNSNQFQYNAYGEMTQFTTPLGAVLGWQYRTFVYTAGNSSRQYREVQTRTMSPAYNGSTNTWSLSLANGTGSLHGTGTVQDLGAQSEKLWTFNTSTTALAGNTPYPDALLGSLTAYDEIFTGSGGPTTLLHKDYTPWQSSGGQAYESTIVTTLNPGAGPAQTRTVQTLDNHGNLTQSQITDYAGSATGTRTYNMTYTAGSSNYAARYIFNRLLTATVTNGGSPLALVNNTYDSGCFTNGMTNTNATNSHDPAYNTSVTIRGNLSGTSGLNGSGWHCTAYDTAGVPYYSWNGTQSVAIQTDSTTDYSLPTAIQPNSNSDMQTSATYASSWAPTSLTGPNGDQGTTTYDSYGRPAQTTIPDGAVTTYTYAYYNSATQSGANSQTATLDGRWQTTTLDGFGRTIRVQTGNGSTTVSTVDTQYAPCACSPLGKMSAVSQPYAPGGTPRVDHLHLRRLGPHADRDRPRWQHHQVRLPGQQHYRDRPRRQVENLLRGCLRQPDRGDRAQPGGRRLRHQLHLHLGQPAHRRLHDPRQRYPNADLPLQWLGPDKRHQPGKRHRDLHLRRRPPRHQPHRRAGRADAVLLRFLRAPQRSAILPMQRVRRNYRGSRDLLL
jgi:YD repeat-containing protein